MKRYLLLISLAAAMAGCGGGGGSSAGGGVSNAENSQVQRGFDAFIGYVASLINTGSDQAEPVAVDGVAATTPEDAEPAPLM